MRRGVRLKYLDSIGRFKSGNIRYYYRRNGNRVPMPDLPSDHPDFIAKYSQAHGSKPMPQSRSGTIAAGVDAYFASTAYLSLAASTRAQRRSIAEKIKRKYGRGTLATLEARHIRRDLFDYEPAPSLNRWKVWRALGRFWFASGLTDTNSCKDIPKPKLLKSDGFAPATREDFAAFRKFWKVGTQQRLAFELAYQTCASAVDLVALGPANIKSGWISYRRSKTGVLAESPMTDIPLWFEASPYLVNCLNAAPKHMTFLTTARGTSRSEKAVSSWFSKACNTAQLNHMSLHSVRKGRAAMFRENGALPDQRMAVLGHLTESETHEYSKSADLRRIISGTGKVLNSEQSAKNG